MTATTRSRRLLVAVAGGILVSAVTGCVQVVPRERAVDIARGNFELAAEGIENLLPDLPRTGLRDEIIRSGAFGASASLIDADDAKIRAEAYGLTGQGSYVLDAEQEGDVATVLLFVSGYFETGGGWSYVKEIVHTCLTVTMDLEQQTLEYEGCPCTDGVYAVVTHHDEVDFAEVAGEG